MKIAKHKMLLIFLFSAIWHNPTLAFNETDYDQSFVGEAEITGEAEKITFGQCLALAREMPSILAEHQMKRECFQHFSRSR